MPEYRGNAIYEYVQDNGLDYYFSAADNWILVYGDSGSIPKILVFASKVGHICEPFQREETENVHKAMDIADDLKLPFVFVRFMENSGKVSVWKPRMAQCKILTYDQLRYLYGQYGIIQHGTIGKEVNQYISSSYHDWQRQSLGKITVSDLDLLKYRNGRIEEIIELKRSKKRIQDWSPYQVDYPNFALLINTISGSGRNIPFKLYYNVMRDGPAGRREEDISVIKAYEFHVPGRRIGSQEVRYRCCGVYRINELLF